jgi:hypothetical protein
VAEQVRDIYFVNITLHGSGGGDDWSVDLRRIRFYLILAVVCWVLRQVVSALSQRVQDRRGRPSNWLTLPGVLLEGLWVFASFLALAAAGGQLLSWLRTRAVWEFAGSSWRRLISVLPDLSLPFDLTLPRVVAEVGHWFWHSLLPGVGTAMLLPLVWLALTATVFGWQQLNARDLVAGTPIEGHATRVTERLSRGRHTASWRAGRRSLDILTGDLRTKYHPHGDPDSRLHVVACSGLVGVLSALHRGLPAAQVDLLSGRRSGVRSRPPGGIHRTARSPRARPPVPRPESPNR